MGINGAALGTGIGIVISTVFGIIYFLTNIRGTLYFVKPNFNISVL